jgi:RNA polymerase sigma-70 factor (ECF subfamily)
MAGGDIDDALVRARQGDASALSELFVAYTPKLVRMVELRMDNAQRQRCDPSDVVQDALLEATQRFAQWGEQRELPFHVWLRFLTAQSLTRSRRFHAGTQKRDLAREDGLDSKCVSASRVADWILSSQTSPTQAARRSEVREMVLAALEQLDELDREILALRHFEQLSNEEAAAELGIEPAAASKRFTRALQRMRPALRALQPQAGGP